MKTYLVRLKSDKDIAGLAAARDWLDLADLIDETADPHDYEAREIVGKRAMLWLDGEMCANVEHAAARSGKWHDLGREIDEDWQRKRAKAMKLLRP